MTVTRRTWLLLVFWCVLFAAALAMDGAIARWVERARPVNKASVVKRWVKRPGDFTYAWVVIPGVAVVHAARWRAGAALLLASAFSGVLSAKWPYGRHRPSHVMAPYTFHPFIDGLHGMFYAKALSFPSGHTALAFTTASCLAALFPRGWALFYAVAVGVAIERVLEGAHYPSDVVAGAAIGILATRLALLVCEKRFGPAWQLGAPRPPDTPKLAEPTTL